MQEIKEAKRSTMSISKSANVVSRFTSFVAVDKDSNQPVSGPLRKHFVPYYQSADFSRPMVMPNGSLICGGASPLQPTYYTLRPTSPTQSSLPPMYSALSCTPSDIKRARLDLAVEEKYLVQELREGSAHRFLLVQAAFYRKKR